MWVDDASDTGISIVLWLASAAIVVAIIVSWLWTRNNRRRIARYEAWLERRKSENEP